MKLSNKYKGGIKTCSIKKIYFSYNLSQKATGRCAPQKSERKPRRMTWNTANKGAHNKRGEGNLQKDAEEISQDENYAPHTEGN